MRRIKLGRTDIKVSVIGLGCWQFGDENWGWNVEIDERKAIEIIRKGYELGINFFDTAEIYGNGVSEIILGKAVKDFREEIIIATKFSPRHARYKDIIKACNKSLERLNTKYIDLYQMHWPNHYVPLKETAEALDFLYKEGKIRVVGVSNFPIPLIKELKKNLKYAELVSNQLHYNLIERTIEKEIMPYCLRNNITIIAFSPLEQGLLTGKYNSKNIPSDNIRRNNVFFKKENIEKIEELIRNLEEIAKKYNRSIAQIALNWIIRHPNTIAIPGAKNLGQLIDNISSSEFDLTEEDFLKLTEVSSKINIEYF
jgi:Predicted oxidoreductases (related to aryl-alcohol dehydrogenases)